MSLVFAALLSGDPAQACESARERRLAGEFSAAEEAAHECLREAPDNLEAKMELSRALGAQDSLEEALQVADEVAQSLPDSVEVQLWRFRLMAWLGRVQEARDELGAFLADQESGVQGDLGVAELEADLAFWSSDYGEAVESYSTLIEGEPQSPGLRRSRGLALMEMGRMRDAADDFGYLCRELDHGGATGDAAQVALASMSSEGCTLEELALRRQYRYRLRLQPGLTMVDVSDNWRELGGALEVDITDALTMGVNVDHRSRSWPGTDLQHDLLAGVTAYYRLAERHSLAAHFGGGFDPIFSPLWQAWVEGGVAPYDWLQFYTRIWHLEFRNGRATVLSPALVFTGRRWDLYTRYYLGFDDERDAAHAGWTRFSHDLFWRLRGHIGAGVGTVADYLWVSDVEMDWHWLLMAGVSASINHRNSIQFNYTYREDREDTEQFGSRVLRLNHFTLGYTFHF